MLPGFKRHLLCCTLFCFFTLPVAAQEFLQDFKALNAVYIEAGGNGEAVSLNYDRVIYQRMFFKTALRVGIGTNFFFLDAEPSAYPIVPVEAIGMIGRKRKHLEFGLGYTKRFTDEPELGQDIYFARLGLRYQVPRGGLLVRVGFTPSIAPGDIENTPGIAIMPRFGFSLGYSL